MSEVLPYIGDDLAQVSQLLEGLQTARSHILTFVSDLGSARSSTNAAWQATEATYSGNQAAGLLSSGESISQSLDSGIRAVDLYSTELSQGRQTVDVLREEWIVARSQAAELQSRTLLTAEDVVAANAFAARLTDQFDDLKRRYNTVLTSVEAAAGACSRVLTIADDSAGNVAVAYEKPPPEFYADRTRRHNTARDAAVEQIREEVLNLGGDPSTVRIEVPIPGYTGKGGQYGNVDAYWDDGSTVWIWEVKGTAQSGMPIAGQGTSAVNEAAGYAASLQNYFDANGIERQVSVGFPVNPTSAQYTDHQGTVEDLNVRNYGPGAVVYTIQGNDPTETVLEQMVRNAQTQATAIWDGTTALATGAEVAASEVVDTLNEGAEAVVDGLNHSAEAVVDTLNDSAEAVVGGLQTTATAVIDAAESIPEDVARAVVEAYGN